MLNNVLTIRNLKKNYHTKTDEITALKEINFSVKDKEFISIVGPSGCGKSTILSILANIIDKSEGTITFNKQKPVIGYMLQQDALFPWLTVLENCLIGLEIKKELTEENKKKVITLLKSYGLNDFINKYPENLSGGMRQRVVCM